jgi:hypothetical protein
MVEHPVWSRKHYNPKPKTKGEESMKPEKRAQQIKEKISKIVADKSQVIASYHVSDNSVQAELRLCAEWEISVLVDEINYPRDLNPDLPNKDLWQQMCDLAWEIKKISTLIERRVPEGYGSQMIPINARTKTGPEKRAEAKNIWLIETGKQFLANYKAVTGKKHLAEIRRQITDLQTQQKNLLPKLRESNSLYLSGKKTERDELAQKNAEAIKSGKFWEADKDTLKGYFHPPFDKNYLADVSEKWRAALFLECESISYKWGDRNWGHKLGGTGRGYLCGIDNNGDEWGHRVENLPQSRDNYDNAGLDSTVEEAMANLFEITQTNLATCQRQGDLLFCPEEIPGERIVCENCGQTWNGEYWDCNRRCIHCGMTPPYINGPKALPAVEIHPEEKWTPRKSHEITSPSLQRNGPYFRADHEIIVSHTSHPTVILPAGEYRLYSLRIADAD